MSRQFSPSPISSIFLKIYSLLKPYKPHIIMSFPHLPTELQQNIYGNLNYERKSLQALRLVSKSINSNATRQLFKTIRLNILRSDWHKADKIANQLGLAQYVEEVQFEHLSARASALAMLGYERGIASFICAEPKRFEGIPSLALLHTEKRSEINLKLLPNLRTVKSADWRGLSRHHYNSIRIEMIATGGLNKVYARGRFEVEVPLFHEFFSRFIGSRMHIKTLHLQQLSEFLWEQSFYCHHYNSSNKQLQNLKIDLFVSHRSELSLQKWCLDGWIIELDMLETFKLSQGQCGHGQCDHSYDTAWRQSGPVIPAHHECNHILRLWPAVNVIKLFSVVRWPRLRHLHLQYPVVTNLDLQNFLLLHRDTLRTVRIEYPLVGPEAWRQFLKWMSISSIRLSRFEYTDPYSGPTIYNMKGDFNHAVPKNLDHWFENQVVSYPL